MSKKYLDSNGLSYFWNKLKAFFQAKLVSGSNIKTINNQSLLGSGNISISAGEGGTSEYDQLNNLPEINSNVLLGDQSSEDLGLADVVHSHVIADITDFPTIPVIPTNISAFTNDVGYLTSFTETDPTVPAWAKASTKPSYNFSELGNKPTTLSGFGITDAKISNGVITLGGNTITPLTSFTETDPTVPSWAKASSKPSYNFLEIGNKPTTLAGYGITDAKIVNGVITLGEYSITPLTSFTETDPVFMASAAHGISSSDISNWNSKQSAIGNVTVNLEISSWSNNTQTVNVTGVTSSNTVVVSPVPSSISDYASAGIYCSAQGSGTLTFTCSTTPTNAITVNVMIVG